MVVKTSKNTPSSCLLDHEHRLNPMDHASHRNTDLKSQHQRPQQLVGIFRGVCYIVTAELNVVQAIEDTLADYISVQLFPLCLKGHGHS